MTNKDPVMDWPGIVAELHRNGMTLTGLAHMNGLNPAIFRQTKSRTNYNAQKIIADFIDHKPEDLWPSRYPKGKPRVLDTNKYPRATSQKSQQSADNRTAA